MTFNELLEQSKKNPKYAFFLGMVYGWPIVKNGYVLAYSSGRTGTRIRKNFSDNEYTQLNEPNRQVLADFIKGTAILSDDIDCSSNKTSWVCSVKFTETNSLDDTTEIGRARIYGYIEKATMDFSNECIRYFVSGLFNARCSLDFSRKLVTVDWEKKKYPNLARRKYMTLSNMTGQFFNFNPRVLQKNSKAKNDQFRIPLKIFVSEYGFLYPFKRSFYEKETGKHLTQIDGLYFDKQDLSNVKEYKNYNRALQINKLAIDYQDGRIAEQELLKKRLALGLDNDDDVDTLLHANPNVKEARKLRSRYMCEVNPRHRTFTAKANNMPFVEGHHLIPFCKRNEFDVNIDIVENIVALCPVCHRQVHLATDNEKRDILTKLYETNIRELQKAGVNISLEQLIVFYD
ncbi:MAG: hypothetical protein K2L95_05095 [Alphaproteobacteria bacterium]|nr:hypothetical protein [Alphaproteobacteria bacterium]